MELQLHKKSEFGEQSNYHRARNPCNIDIYCNGSYEDMLHEQRRSGDKKKTEMWARG